MKSTGQDKQIKEQLELKKHYHHNEQDPHPHYNYNIGNSTSNNPISNNPTNNPINNNINQSNNPINNNSQEQLMHEYIHQINSIAALYQIITTPNYSNNTINQRDYHQSLQDQNPTHNHHTILSSLYQPLTLDLTSYQTLKQLVRQNSLIKRQSDSALFLSRQSEKLINFIDGFGQLAKGNYDQQYFFYAQTALQKSFTDPQSQSQKSSKSQSKAKNKITSQKLHQLNQQDKLKQILKNQHKMRIQGEQELKRISFERKSNSQRAQKVNSLSKQKNFSKPALISEEAEYQNVTVNAKNIIKLDKIKQRSLTSQQKQQIEIQQDKKGYVFNIQIQNQIQTDQNNLNHSNVIVTKNKDTNQNHGEIIKQKKNFNKNQRKEQSKKSDQLKTIKIYSMENMKQQTHTNEIAQNSVLELSQIIRPQYQKTQVSFSENNQSESGETSLEQSRQSQLPMNIHSEANRISINQQVKKKKTIPLLKKKLNAKETIITINYNEHISRVKQNAQSLQSFEDPQMNRKQKNIAIVNNNRLANNTEKGFVSQDTDANSRLSTFTSNHLNSTSIIRRPNHLKDELRQNQRRSSLSPKIQGRKNKVILKVNSSSHAQNNKINPSKKIECRQNFENDGSTQRITNDNNQSKIKKQSKQRKVNSSLNKQALEQQINKGIISENGENLYTQQHNNKKSSQQRSQQKSKQRNGQRSRQKSQQLQKQIAELQEQFLNIKQLQKQKKSKSKSKSKQKHSKSDKLSHTNNGQRLNYEHQQAIQVQQRQLDDQQDQYHRQQQANSKLNNSQSGIASSNNAQNQKQENASHLPATLQLPIDRSKQIPKENKTLQLIKRSANTYSHVNSIANTVDNNGMGNGISNGINASNGTNKSFSINLFTKTSTQITNKNQNSIVLEQQPWQCDELQLEEQLKAIDQKIEERKSILQQKQKEKEKEKDKEKEKEKETKNDRSKQKTLLKQNYSQHQTQHQAQHHQTHNQANNNFTNVSNMHKHKRSNTSAENHISNNINNITSRYSNDKNKSSKGHNQQICYNEHLFQQSSNDNENQQNNCNDNYQMRMEQCQNHQYSEPKVVRLSLTALASQNNANNKSRLSSKQNRSNNANGNGKSLEGRNRQVSKASRADKGSHANHANHIVDANQANHFSQYDQSNCGNQVVSSNKSPRHQPLLNKQPSCKSILLYEQAQKRGISPCKSTRSLSTRKANERKVSPIRQYNYQPYDQYNNQAQNQYHYYQTQNQWNNQHNPHYKNYNNDQNNQNIINSQVNCQGQKNGKGKSPINAVGSGNNSNNLANNNRNNRNNLANNRNNRNNNNLGSNSNKSNNQQNNSRNNKDKSISSGNGGCNKSQLYNCPSQNAGINNNTKANPLNHTRNHHHQHGITSPTPISNRNAFRKNFQLPNYIDNFQTSNNPSPFHSNNLSHFNRNIDLQINHQLHQQHKNNSYTPKSILSNNSRTLSDMIESQYSRAKKGNPIILENVHLQRHYTNQNQQNHHQYRNQYGDQFNQGYPSDQYDEQNFYNLNQRQQNDSDKYQSYRNLMPEKISEVVKKWNTPAINNGNDKIKYQNSQSKQAFTGNLQGKRKRMVLLSDQIGGD